MLDTDLEEVPLTNWFDSVSDFPEISSVNSTPNPGVNVISPSGNIHHKQTLGIEDSNATGSASNTDNPVGYVLLEETGSDEGLKILKAPKPYSPSKQATITFFVSPWLGHG